MRFKNSFINRLVFKYELAMSYTRNIYIYIYIYIYINLLFNFLKFLTLTCDKRYVFLSFGE